MIWSCFGRTGPVNVGKQRGKWMTQCMQSFGCSIVPCTMTMIPNMVANQRQKGNKTGINDPVKISFNFPSFFYLLDSKVYLVFHTLLRDFGFGFVQYIMTSCNMLCVVHLELYLPVLKT